jgi:hypothetical protein
MTYGGLFQNQIVKHLVCLRVNGDGANTLPHWDPLYGT